MTKKEKVAAIIILPLAVFLILAYISGTFRFRKVRERDSAGVIKTVTKLEWNWANFPAYFKGRFQALSNKTKHELRTKGKKAATELYHFKKEIEYDGE